jgi:hypothetical protein
MNYSTYLVWLLLEIQMESSRILDENQSNKQCWGSQHFGADPDPHIWLIDPDPASDPTSFFSDGKDAKKLFIFSYFFLLTYLQAHYLQS